MKNDLGNKTRRRKGALQRLEDALTAHRQFMQRGLDLDGSPFTEDQKQCNVKNEIRMGKEIEILKKRIGGHTNA